MSERAGHEDTETDHDEARGPRSAGLPVNGSGGPGDPGSRVDPAEARTAEARTAEAVERPLLFETDSGVIVLADVSSVQCYASTNGNVCQVYLRTGASFVVDIRFSRPLIQAVRAHYARPAWRIPGAD